MKTLKELPSIIVPTVKVVSAGCNLRCHYCYYNDFDQADMKLMNFSTLENLIRKTFEFIKKDKMAFVWHGGEPMLAGIPFYERVLEIENKFKGEITIRNDIQTNATLINKEWADFFAENNFSVGVSIDGPKHIHDAYRVYKSGEGSFKSVMRGLQNLHDVDIYPGIIALITKESLSYPQEIFDFFVSNNIRNIHLKPCYELNPRTGELTKFSVTPEEYGNFMVEIMEVWFLKDDPKIRLRDPAEIMKGMLGGKPSLCAVSGQCNLFFTIEHNGLVTGCDSFPIRKYQYGNINTDDWSDILSSETYSEFLSDFRENEKRCLNCKWFSVCHGCCIRYSYSALDDSWHHNKLCEAKKIIFEYLDKKIKALA